MPYHYSCYPTVPERGFSFSVVCIFVFYWSCFQSGHGIRTNDCVHSGRVHPEPGIWSDVGFDETRRQMRLRRWQVQVSVAGTGARRGEILVKLHTVFDNFVCFTINTLQLIKLWSDWLTVFYAAGAFKLGKSRRKMKKKILDELERQHIDL